MGEAADGAGGLGQAVAWRHSLRTRLMGWTGLLAALLLGGAFLAAFLMARQRILDSAEARTRFEADQAAERIEAAMRSVEITGRGMAGLVNHLNLDRDQRIVAMDLLLREDGSAVGALLALEPEASADGKPFAYYVGRQEAGVFDSDLVGKGYDYRSKDWYRRTLHADRAWWSEPYFNETAGGLWMTTLNLPLRSADGARRLGMVSVDVPVRRLSFLLDALRAQPGMRPALFAPGGTIALHPDIGVALQGTLDQYVVANHRTDLAPLQGARAARVPVEFTHTDPNSQDTRYTVFRPIGQTGWGLQLAMSHKPMLATLDRMAWLVGSGAAVALVLVLLLVRRLARRITDPLRELTDSAAHFAAGQFDWPVPHDTRRDEVGVMARALERARDSIRQQLDEIEQMAAARQKLESELSIARDIQLAMLPSGRVIDAEDAHLEAHSVLEPARMVGGDFYTFFEREPGRLWFVIGDVSDKGVPAALFMARSVTLLETAARLAGTPAAALAEASRRLVEGNDTCMFATVLCGVVDVESGELALCSAGHEPPIWVHADGRRELLPVLAGPPLGFEVSDEFATWRGRLQPGDTLLAYTDGITEAFDPDDLAYGTERLLAQMNAGVGAQEQCSRLVADVRTFVRGAPQSDDITVLAIHLRREAAAVEE